MLTVHIFASSELFLGHNFFHILLYIFVSIAFSIFKAFIFCIVLKKKNLRAHYRQVPKNIKCSKILNTFLFSKCMLLQLQLTKCLPE